MWDSADWRGVVFVSDRPGAAVQRRERCLALAGIASSVLTERRPSGTYYKLCVRDQDVIDAHLTLRLGGFCRSLRLRKESPGAVGRVEDWAREAWDRALLLVTLLLDLVRESPRLLAGPGRTSAAS